MKRYADLIAIVFLSIVFIALYLPVFSSTYLFTDEYIQIWFYGKQPGYQMFMPNGRYVTEKLMEWLFSSIQYANQVQYLRFFSFLGWLLSIPIWYILLKRIVIKEGLPVLIAFAIVLFLIAAPSLSISIVWASCLELFVANTFGFISGYFFYSAIKPKQGRMSVSPVLLILAIICGVISLFTYQTGFGCFFIPFLLHLISPSSKDKRLAIIGIGGYLLIAAIYYLLFKYNLKVAGIGDVERTGIHISPWEKLLFFFTRPMSSAFHYTFLITETKIIGYIIYAILSGTWVVLFWLRSVQTAVEKIKLLAIIGTVLLLAYLPMLIVKENYASNRTMLALGVCVWVLTIEMIFSRLKTAKARNLSVVIMTVLFISNAWYNTYCLFLKPVKNEYVQLRTFFERQYNPGISTVYFIRPQEDFFVRKYGITRSWDEFGVPSSFFNWVPEFFVRQLVFEITKDRQLAEKMVIKHWLGKEEFIKSGTTVPANTLLIDAEEIINGVNP